jgi:hypothetical protein
MTPARRAPAGDRPETMTAVLRTVREIVAKECGGLRVETKWGVRWYVGRDLVLAFAAFDRHVSIEFWRGSLLANMSPMIEGTGKNLRHVKIRTSTEARSPELRRVLREALKLDSASPPRKR